jgi:glutaredoxin
MFYSDVHCTKQVCNISLQDALKEMTGQRTVPSVFIKGQNIGGGTETAELYQSGRLKELLEQHGLLKK